MFDISNTVLSEVGWEKSLPAPQLNAENMALIEEIKKVLELVEMENKSERNDIKCMAETLKVVKKELEYTDVLWQAKERDENSDKHLRALRERETGHMLQERSRIEKDLKSLAARKVMQDNQCLKVKEKIEEFKNKVHWDEQTLDLFLEESAIKEEDAMAIIKYSQQDEKRIKTINLAMEKKILEASQKRKGLDKELTDTQSAQIALDKTTELLQQTLLETQQFTRQWENTIKQMKQGDAQIHECVRQLPQAKQNIRERHSTIAEVKYFEDIQRRNNNETERVINITKKEVAQLQQDLKEWDKKCGRLKDEKDSWQAALERTFSDVQSLRSDLYRMEQDIMAKTEKLEEARAHNMALEEKLNNVTRATLSEEERAAHLEQFRMDEELAIKELEIQMHEHQEKLFGYKQLFQTNEKKEKNLTAQISKSKSSIASLEKQHKKLEHELYTQQATVSKQDSEITSLSLKLVLMQGDTHLDENKALQLKINELANNLEERKKSASMLKNILKEAEDDIRYLSREIETSEAQNRDLTSKVEELMIITNNDEKEIKRFVITKQDTLVDNNILKIEVKRKTDLLYNKVHSVLSLEKRQRELQNVIKEREDEIGVCRKMLSLELKAREQERQMLSLELNKVLIKNDMMMKRFEVQMLSGMAPEGEEEKSKAYYIIKAVQEKEELKQKGDSLDAKICQMEKENRALENTIQLFSNNNSVFHNSLKRVNESETEYQEKMKEEEQLTAVSMKMKFKNGQIQELQQDLQDMNVTLEGLLQEEETRTRDIEYKQFVISKVNKEIKIQQERCDRARKRCSMLNKEIRSAGSTETGIFVEVIKLKELKEFKKSVDTMLTEAMKNKPNLKAKLQI